MEIVALMLASFSVGFSLCNLLYSLCRFKRNYSDHKTGKCNEKGENGNN